MQELVIKIPEEKLNIIKNKMYCGIYDSDLYEIIANGIPLLKGHGKIIDESTITEVYAHKTEPKEINEIQIYPRIEIIGTNAPTIIEADRSEE